MKWPSLDAACVDGKVSLEVARARSVEVLQPLDKEERTKAHLNQNVNKILDLSPSPSFSFLTGH